MSPPIGVVGDMHATIRTLTFRYLADLCEMHSTSPEDVERIQAALQPLVWEQEPKPPRTVEKTVRRKQKAPVPPAPSSHGDLTPLVEAVRKAGQSGVTSRELLNGDLPQPFKSMDARGLGKVLARIPELHKASSRSGVALWAVKNGDPFGSKHP